MKFRYSRGFWELNEVATFWWSHKISKRVFSFCREFNFQRVFQSISPSTSNDFFQYNFLCCTHMPTCTHAHTHYTTVSPCPPLDWEELQHLHEALAHDAAQHAPVYLFSPLEITEPQFLKRLCHKVGEVHPQTQCVASACAQRLNGRQKKLCVYVRVRACVHAVPYVEIISFLPRRERIPPGLTWLACVTFCRTISCRKQSCL